MTQAVEPYHHPGDREVDRAVALLKASPRLVAGAFTVNREIDWGAVALSCATCLDLGLDPLLNAAKMPVVKDKVYPMAEICRVLAGRHGWYIDFIEDTPTVCTGVIYRGDRRPAPLTITVDEGKKMGSAGTNENWDKDPRTMLKARVSRRLVLTYCPEVLAGPPPGQVIWDDTAAPVAPTTNNISNAPLMVPARSVAPDGSTIPEYLREPEVDQAVRDQLVERVAALDDETRDDLAHVCMDLKLPNLKTVRFTRAHGALLDRLIGEALDREETRLVQEFHDNAPESRNYEEDDEDPGRPFE